MDEERLLFILVESGPNLSGHCLPLSACIQNEESRFRGNV